MKSSLVLLSLVIGTIEACQTDNDCSLNGLCNSQQVCDCDPSWSGDECEILNFEPVAFPQGYGMSPNTTSWGGGAIYEASTQLYHLYVARMTNDCLLEDWTQNSRVDHATSKSITGPYEFQDVAINTWSHNPAPVTLKDGSYAIFHIGDGTGGPDGGNNCTSGSRAKFLQPEQQQHLVKETQRQTIHIATDLNGPWKPLSPNTLPGCNNPAPWVHKNGTIYINCENILYKSEDISGPWAQVSAIPTNPPGGVDGQHFEDPYVYVDKRGAFHLLYHVYQTVPAYQCVNATVSAHGYSSDGYTWTIHPTQPFTTQIAMQSGDVITVSTRERPKLFFDQDGYPTHLFNGVSSATACPPPGGPKTGCVDCKYKSWDYTLVAPLKR